MLANGAPLLQTTWTDPVTGTLGHLVVHDLPASRLCTGGTRMRLGCTLDEVMDLARGMSLKTGAFDLPVGGAKGGIDCDPHDPQAREILGRFVKAMQSSIDAHWVTAEDLGTPQWLIDEVFAELGLDQSYHAAIRRSKNPKATLLRVKKGLHAPVEGGFELGDVVGGYGVAQACLGVANAWNKAPQATTVAIQGAGTMGGSAAFYLHKEGVKVVALADAKGTLYDREGLDIPALLEARDRYGEIDRSQVPAKVRRLKRDAVLSCKADILVPAAVSYAITPGNAGKVKAQAIVEAANAAIMPRAELTLASRGIPVIPGFVANAGAAVWAWWLLLGQVSADPEETFTRLRTEMRDKVGRLMNEWQDGGVMPQAAAYRLAERQLEEEDYNLVIP